MLEMKTRFKMAESNVWKNGTKLKQKKYNESVNAEIILPACYINTTRP